MNGEYAALAARIRASLNDVQRVMRRAEALRDKAQSTGDDGYWDGVALNLHGFYAGIEQIFEDIARTMEAGIPPGPNWHQALVLQMSQAVAGVRPGVITDATRQCLEEYRSFRHVVRNVYTFNLRPARLQALVAGLQLCHEAIVADLSTFAELLDRLARADEPEQD